MTSLIRQFFDKLAGRTPPPAPAQLEERFNYSRPLRGFRLARTGKHRHGSLTKHQVALRREAGSKLSKKAQEGKL
jgi:hypothetical protein